jgi:hypothetical protein
MSHPALPRIESGLAGSHAALLQGDLDAMHASLVQTLDALAEVTRAGFVPRHERPPHPPWNEPRTRELVWGLLARFKAAGCHVFPYAGTLLGLERSGQLLPNDKDADLAVWLEDYGLAARLLQQWGLQRASDVPPFDNMATFVAPASGDSVDLFGLRRDPVRQCVEGGLWLHGRPPSHQRVLQLPWFTLVARGTPAGEAWWPGDADAVLGGLYGDWRTPRPEWDSQVSNPSVRDLNLSWHCWAFKSLCSCWLTGDLAKTGRLMDQVGARIGDDPRLRQWRDALDAALRT